MNSVNMSMYGVGWRGRDNELLSTVNGFPFGTKQDFFDHPSLLLYYAQWTKMLEFESLKKSKTELRSRNRFRSKNEFWLRRKFRPRNV